MNDKMRIYHRYLGYFLSGIMAVYAISGITLIFRETDFFMRDEVITKQLAPGLNPDQLEKKLRIGDLKAVSETENTITFRVGTYNKQSGEASYTVKDLPYFLKQITEMHKASTTK